MPCGRGEDSSAYRGTLSPLPATHDLKARVSENYRVQRLQSFIDAAVVDDDHLTA